MEASRSKESIAAEMPFVLGPLRWEPMPTRAAVSTVILSASLVGPEWRFPLLCEVAAGSAIVPAWAWREGELQGNDETLIKVVPGGVALSRGLRRLLLREGTIPDHVSLHLLESSFLEVAPALTSHIAEGAVVHVPKALLVERPVRLRPWQATWGLLVYDGICAPVQVRSHNAEADLARCGLLLRALIGVKEGESVQLAMLTPAELRKRFRLLRARRATRSASILGRALALGVRSILKAVRVVDLGVETALRALLRSPTVVVRTTQAAIGDDSASVIRLHPELFAALGVAARSTGADHLVWPAGCRHSSGGLRGLRRRDILLPP